MKTSALLEADKETPFYLPVKDEVDLFLAAYHNRLPVMLKGPTGCGKTRFVSYMAQRLHRSLITVACHDDLSASDLVGRFLIRGGETLWVDGPLTRALRLGAICYLDEIVEARKDTTVVIHPLTDFRRSLFLEKTGEELTAPDEFSLVISYNPGYQSSVKDLKPSTRQRFVAIEMGFPPPEIEAEVVAHESGVDLSLAKDLVTLGQKIRNLKDKGLPEGASTRLLVYAGKLMVAGVSVPVACRVALAQPLTDDPEMLSALYELVDSVL
jgi:nitric oxide reductase NorQ protein